MTQFDDTINHPVVAGGLGAFVSLILARKMTAPQALLSWIAGFACAIYLAPVLIVWWPWLGKSAAGTTFAVGMFGLQIVAIFYDICVVLKDDPQATISMVLDVLRRKRSDDK